MNLGVFLCIFMDFHMNGFIRGGLRPENLLNAPVEPMFVTFCKTILVAHIWRDNPIHAHWHEWLFLKCVEVLRCYDMSLQTFTQTSLITSESNRT